MTTRLRLLLLMPLIAACGRNTENAKVRLVGVGSDPETIGASPTPYGGLVSYDNVELSGGGLSLAHMGLGSFTEVGPGFANFAPPYRAIVGFSYLFDAKLSAADTLTFTAPVPPVNTGTCYTTFSPQGPIGSFNTVDVGDYMEFVSGDGTKRFRMVRNPTDVPPDARDEFVYYSTIEPWAPTARNHRVPGSDASDPRAMREEAYMLPNYPFGEEMQFRFPGGATRFDQPISSIPRPSAAATTGTVSQTIRLPSDLGGVQMSWNGPRFDGTGQTIGDGDQSTCLEFYGDGHIAPDSPEACATEPVYPSDKASWDKFPGQIYTGPWDTADGKIQLHWTPGAEDEPVSFAVRFMAPVDQADPNYLIAKHGDRAASTCEQGQDGTTWEFDQSLSNEPAMEGDPFSRMVEVSCLFEDTGSAEVSMDQMGEAFAYLAGNPAGGAIFFFGRTAEVEADVPFVKDPFDERHDISPVLLASKVVRVGRFHWDQSVVGGGQ